MKRSIRFILLLNAALLSFAAISVASASANTVFCSSAVTTCPASKVLPAGSYVVTNANYLAAPKPGSFVVNGPGFPVSCKGATLSHKSTASSGAPLSGELNSLFGYEACAMPGLGSTTTCEVATNSPPETIEATGSGGGKVTIGTILSPLVISFECINNSNSKVIAICSYQSSGTTQTIVPVEGGDLKATIYGPLTKVSQTQGSKGFCEATGEISMVGKVIASGFISSSS